MNTNARIQMLEEQMAQLLEKEKRFLEENRKKKKQLSEQISFERKKEETRMEKLLKQTVEDCYGEINEESIRKLKEILLSATVPDEERRSGVNE